MNKERLFFWQLNNRPHQRSRFYRRSPATLGDPINIWRLSRHVESISSWRDNRRLLFFFVAVCKNTAKRIIWVRAWANDGDDDKTIALALPALKNNNQLTMVTREDAVGSGGASEGG
jgi:hypothetical protein